MFFISKFPIISYFLSNPFLGKFPSIVYWEISYLFHLSSHSLYTFLYWENFLLTPPQCPLQSLSSSHFYLGNSALRQDYKCRCPPAPSREWILMIRIPPSPYANGG